MEFNVRLFYSIIILLVAFQSAGSTQMNPEVRCILVYDPVCGRDGKTYGNSCELRGANQKCAYCGECNSDLHKPCPLTGECSNQAPKYLV